MNAQFQRAPSRWAGYVIAYSFRRMGMKGLSMPSMKGGASLKLSPSTNCWLPHSKCAKWEWGHLGLITTRADNVATRSFRERSRAAGDALLTKINLGASRRPRRRKTIYSSLVGLIIIATATALL